MAEKANHVTGDERDELDQSVVISGPIGQMLQIGKRHGPGVMLLVVVLSGVGVAFYNAIQWVGVAVIAPITEQHVKTLQLIQQQSIDHASTLRAVERSVERVVNALETNEQIILDNGRKIEANGKKLDKLEEGFKAHASEHKGP